MFAASLRSYFCLTLAAPLFLTGSKLFVPNSFGKCVCRRVRLSRRLFGRNFVTEVRLIIYLWNPIFSPRASSVSSVVWFVRVNPGQPSATFPLSEVSVRRGDMARDWALYEWARRHQYQSGRHKETAREGQVKIVFQGKFDVKMRNVLWKGEENVEWVLLKI